MARCSSWVSKSLLKMGPQLSHISQHDPSPHWETPPEYPPAWWRHQMETFSALLAIWAGNSPFPGEFPAQRPVTPCFDVFFDLRLIKRLRKQSRGWWFETLSRPLWRHCNVFYVPELQTLMEVTAQRQVAKRDRLCAACIVSNTDQVIGHVALVPITWNTILVKRLLHFIYGNSNSRNSDIAQAMAAERRLSLRYSLWGRY